MDSHVTNDQRQDTTISASPQARALSLYIQNAVENLKVNSTTKTHQQEQSSLIYLGNWQDPYPRLLVTDPVLEPVDKIVWQIIRLHINAPGAVTAFPNYETIRTFANIRSNHTISRALAILRATRWLSLCARVRDSRGRFLGNIYVLHDEPITLGDAMYLDTEYMTFLQTGIEHNHHRVKKIISNVVSTIEDMIGDGIDVTGERIQTWSYERRLGAIRQEQTEPVLQLSERAEFYAISDSRISTLTQEDQDTKDSTKILHTDNATDIQVQNLHTENSEPLAPVQKTHMDQQSENIQVQNLHMAVESENNQVQKMHTEVLRSSSNNINTTTTSGITPHAREDAPLHFPPCISANERELAMMYLNAVDENQQQNVLDEWNGRLSAANRRSTPIENPIGYLASLCKRVKTGEFQITIGLRVRETREREAQQREETQRREAAEQQRHNEFIQSMQKNNTSRAKTKIEKRLEQIHTRSKGDNHDDS